LADDLDFDFLSEVKRGIGTRSSITSVTATFSARTRQSKSSSSRSKQRSANRWPPGALLRIGLPTGESGSSYAFERATPFTVPKLLQEKIIQSFEASKYVGAVVKPMEGIAADYQLLIDLRSFQITGAPTAHVEFAAKILLGRTSSDRIPSTRSGQARERGGRWAAGVM
jgi:hypothetical protein